MGCKEVLYVLLKLFFRDTSDFVDVLYFTLNPKPSILDPCAGLRKVDGADMSFKICW